MHWLLTVTLSLAMVMAWAQSPYAGQEGRAIKALSDTEVAALLAGEGMGLARAGELNGYPGPLHVLELADELELSAAQRQGTETLFAEMQAQAQALGRELVAAERELDALFAARTITSESLQAATAQIGRLQGEIRQVHLDAHLRQTALLTPAQIDNYVRLRGYHHARHAQGHDMQEHH